LEVAAGVLEKLLGDYIAKIIDKATKGGRLTQAEVSMLMVAWTQRDIARLEKKTDETNRRVYEVKTDLEKKIDDVKTDLEKKIDDVKTDLEKKIDSTDKKIDSTDKKIDDVKTDLEKKIDDVKADTTYLKQSLDQLRDNVLTVLVEKLK
jgi:chromosome segregation ATPase